MLMSINMINMIILSILNFFKKLVRSRVFLCVIFVTSLTYFVVNFYNDGSSLLSSSSEVDVDVHELGSVRRPLGHVFWQGAEDNNDTKTNNVKPCRNSVQGKALIADDKGFVCNRQNMLPNGCCKPDTEGTKHFSCETCHNNGCCSIYEYCISCCLQPDKKEVLEDVLGKAAGTLNLLLASVTDHFELCLTKCRTSSQSVQHENSYRNPRAKHCYGEQPPPLETEGTVEVR